MPRGGCTISVAFRGGATGESSKRSHPTATATMTNSPLKIQRKGPARRCASGAGVTESFIASTFLRLLPRGVAGNCYERISKEGEPRIRRHLYDTDGGCDLCGNYATRPRYDQPFKYSETVPAARSGVNNDFSSRETHRSHNHHFVLKVDLRFLWRSLTIGCDNLCPKHLERAGVLCYGAECMSNSGGSVLEENYQRVMCAGR